MKDFDFEAVGVFATPRRGIEVTAEERSVQIGEFTIECEVWVSSMMSCRPARSDFEFVIYSLSMNLCWK